MKYSAPKNSIWGTVSSLGLTQKRKDVDIQERPVETTKIIKDLKHMMCEQSLGELISSA